MQVTDLRVRFEDVFYSPSVQRVWEKGTSGKCHIGKWDYRGLLALSLSWRP